MKKTTIQIAGLTLLMSAASLTLSAQENKRVEPLVSGINSQKTVVTTATDSKENAPKIDPFTVCGRTFSNQTDFDKVTNLVAKKVKTGIAPVIITNEELKELHIISVTTK